MIQHLGDEVWDLVGYTDGVPQYRKASGGLALPKTKARKDSATRGYRAVFRDPPKPRPLQTKDTGTSEITKDVVNIAWWGLIAGIAFAGC